MTYSGGATETVRDATVRNTWEVAKRRIRIDQRRWKPALKSVLASLARDLGVSPESGLDAVLHKMLVYEPGQFFVTHQDSETSDGMLGTLVVVLPSRYAGGALVVHHNGERKVFARTRSAGKKLSLIAFYADCRHELRPVTSGHRVCLTYHLVHRGSRPAGPAGSDPALVEDLAGKVRSWFDTPVPRNRVARDEPKPPDRLVYLLDHEYTERGLGWASLKGRDRARVGALVDAADRADCERHLVLAHVHETWGCFGPDEPYGWRGREWDELVDEQDLYQLDELHDSEIELRHWIGPDGKRTDAPPSHASDHEVCFTRPSAELEPAESEYEGFMGNYGNTMDRWYHRAALVLWPRERAFRVRAEVSPSWALNEIAGLLGRRQVAEARARARSLLPFWGNRGPREEGAAFFTKLLRTVRRLDDGELASGLLEPFSADRLTRGGVAPFVALVGCYGDAWARSVVEAWTDGVWHRRASWLSRLPDLVEALEASGHDDAASLARWILEREVARLEEERATGSRGERTWLGGGRRPLLEEAEPLLRACLASRTTASRDRLVSFLVAPESEIPPEALATLIRKLHGRRTHRPGLGGLYRYTVNAVRSIANGPERERDDWSIRIGLDCSCEVCAELGAFLRDPGRVEHDWPLAKEGRKHVHRVIDGCGLPVEHHTRRSGRPFTLQLRKDESLFTREKQWRARHAKLLDWLETHRDAFESENPAP